MFFRAIIVAALLLSILAPGCSGDGNRLIVGDIEGPDSVDENSSVQYSVSASGDTGITFQWTVDPPSAGTFKNPDSATTTFNSSMVSTDSQVRIIVTICSDNCDPLVKKLAIELKEIEGLSVGEILGPETVEEESSAQFEITAGGDSGIKFEWSLNVSSMGNLVSVYAALTSLQTGEVWADTELVLTVTVRSDNYGPVVRTRTILIRDIVFLVVGEIQGSDSLDELTQAEFSIDASNDAGITYQWTCDPESAGIFENADSPTCTFTASEVIAPTQVSIEVTVNSDHYGPKVRAREIEITNLRSCCWTRSWGGVEYDGAWGMDLDGAGNVYVNGWFRGTADFDPGPDVDIHESHGTLEYFIVKYNRRGDFIWARTWGNGVSDDGELRGGLAADESGNVYSAGWFSGTMDFDPGPGVDEYTATGSKTTYLSKFDTDGNYQWTRVWGGLGNCESRDVCVDNQGHVYVIADFHDTAEFDPGPGVAWHTSNGSLDVCLSKFDDSGNFIWVRTWGGEGMDFSHGVDCDAAGNVYVTGAFGADFGGGADFDPGPDVLWLESNGDKDVFTSRFDPSGELVWARVFGSAEGPDSACGFTVDSTGNSYNAGSFSGSVDFDPGPGEDWHYSNGALDCFVSVLDSDGELVWARTWGGTMDLDKACGIDFDPSGNVYVTGRFQGDNDYDPGPGEDWHSSAGFIDIFLTSFDANGNHRWAHTWGNWWDFGKTIEIDEEGGVYLSGAFDGLVDFDPGDGIENHVSYGHADAVLIKVSSDGT